MTANTVRPTSAEEMLEAEQLCSELWKHKLKAVPGSTLSELIYFAEIKTGWSNC